MNPDDFMDALDAHLNKKPSMGKMPEHYGPEFNQYIEDSMAFMNWLEKGQELQREFLATLPPNHFMRDGLIEMLEMSDIALAQIKAQTEELMEVGYQ